MITREQLRKALIDANIFFEASNGDLFIAIADGDIADDNVEDLYIKLNNADRIATIKSMFGSVDNSSGVIEYLICSNFDPRKPKDT